MQIKSVPFEIETIYAGANVHVGDHEHIPPDMQH